MSSTPGESQSHDDQGNDMPESTTPADPTAQSGDEGAVNDLRATPDETSEGSTGASTDGAAGVDTTATADAPTEGASLSGAGAADTASFGAGAEMGSADQATQEMPIVEDDSEGGARRVTRDELYAREDRRGEQERLAAVRAEHEAATTTAAEPVEPVEPVPAPAPAEAPQRRKPMKYPRTTDRFVPSLGLLLLRLTVAVTFGVHGVQKLLSMDQTAEFFGTLSFFGTALPYPSILALATGVAEVLMAVSLAFGFLVRIAAVGILVISLGALLMVKMTSLPDPLAPGASGLPGELELVLAGTGALLLCVGGGAWALDRLFRRGRYSKDPNDLS